MSLTCHLFDSPDWRYFPANSHSDPDNFKARMEGYRLQARKELPDAHAIVPGAGTVHRLVDMYDMSTNW